MAYAQRLIRTTPDAAFTYLSDITRHGEWSGDRDVSLEQTSEGAVAPGATFRSRVSRFVFEREDELTVTDFEPPLRFGFESRACKGSIIRLGRGYTARYVIEFEPSDEGTLVKKEARVIDAPRLYKIVKPITELALSRHLAKDLQRIAEKLETEDTAA